MADRTTEPKSTQRIRERIARRRGSFGTKTAAGDISARVAAARAEIKRLQRAAAKGDK